MLQAVKKKMALNFKKVLIFKDFSVTVSSRFNFGDNKCERIIKGMKKTVVCQMTLGRTRVSGYTLYNPDSLAFEEFTPLEVKRIIRTEGVNGLMLTKAGEIELDEEGFNQRNLPVKSGVGKFRLLREGIDTAATPYYALTKVADTPDGLVYELVNNISARLPVKEKLVRALYTLNRLSGCWINDATGMIRFADGVEFIDMTKEDTDKEDDSGTGGDDAPGGDQAESGGTVGAADSHISDADSGTAGIVDEMAVQKAGSPDHRDHGEGSTTDAAEPTGATVPEGGLSNPNSIFPAVVAVPAEVVEKLDELFTDTTGEPATDNKQTEPVQNMEKVEQVPQDEQAPSSLSEPEISGADTIIKVEPEQKANPESSNSKKPKQKKSKAKTK